MKKRLALIIISVLSSIFSYGQNNALDRFYQDKIISSINLGKALLGKNEKESAIEFFSEAIGIAEKRNHDYYAGFLVLNNEILEPTIDRFYSLDSLDKARHLVGLYERFYDGIETTLKEAGNISESDYYGYMMFCYNKLMLLTSDHKDYETSIEYGNKYVATAKSQGVFNDDYLEWHKTLVWSQIFGQKFEDAFNEAASIYDESLQLGHSVVDALQMIHSVHDFAMNQGGLYWYKDDVSLQQHINNRWISFIEPLYDSLGASTVDQALMKLDQKDSMTDEVRNEITSSTRIASFLKNCCLAYKEAGYDSAKKALFDYKDFLSQCGYNDLWVPSCVSFFEFLQTMSQHSAVYSFCKLIEPDFQNKDRIDLDDYLIYYMYFFGACDRVGDIRKAIDICFNHFEDDSIKESPWYWQIARLKGSFYISYLGDFEKGLESTLEALRLYKLPERAREGDYILYAGLHGYVGDAYRRAGQFEQAIKYYQADIDICNEHGLDYQKHTPYFYMGRIYHSQKDYEKARFYFEECARMMATTSDTYQNSSPYSYLFDIERVSGRVDKARSYLLRMWHAQLTEYQSFKDYLTVYEQTSYWTKQGAIDYIGGLIAESSPDYNDIYYDMLLTSKGFLQKAETREYNNVMSSNDERLVALYSATHSGKSVNRYDTEEYLSLYRSHSFSSEILSPSWKDVQNTLKKEDVAIEFYKYQIDDMYENPQYGALLLKKNWDKPHFVHLCSETDLKAALRAGSKMYKINGLLFDLLWAPLQKEVKGSKNIFFSPHELLHTINFAAIEDSKGTPLLESFTFHRLSSTYSLCDFRVSRFNKSYAYGGLVYDSDDNTMIAEHRKYNPDSDGLQWDVDTTLTRFGWTYLPNTELEIRNISQILTAANIHVTEYSGTSGTEESFRALSGTHPGHIHLATHGFYLKFSPADSSAIAQSPEKRMSSSISALTRSGLILSNGGRAWKGEHIPMGIDDGILQADEIAAMDLSGTSLLVLSACQTALGDISSDGVYGLQRAFKNAGVDTIIMSLWEVDDKATSDFMTLFYQSLASGQSKHEAFCEAQQKLRKEYGDPYYWAAFIMLD